jgi:hypothetical protein
MLNVAGYEFDFAHVVYAVLEECEHRRRSIDPDDAKAFEHELFAIARTKLAHIKAAYDDVGGSASYWSQLETEVMHTALPQYADAAREMTLNEERGFGLWRRGDLAARLVFALAGLVIGGIIIAIPFIPIFENMFAFALTVGGFLYPDIVRFTAERKHAKVLNRLIAESATYQSNARLHYLTNSELEKVLALPE